MKKLALVGLLAGLFGVAGAAPAADTDDPVGIWALKTKLGKKDIEQTLKIENKDGKLTGTITAGKMETKIEDGKFKSGELTFTTTNEAKGNKIVTKYTAKISADIIKGSSSVEYNGKAYKSDFEGKREKAEKKKD